MGYSCRPLPMSAVAAIVVIVAWFIVSTLAGAWRTRNREA